MVSPHTAGETIMSQEPITMRQLREVLRLYFSSGLSNRKIARALTLSPTTVGNYIKGAKAGAIALETLPQLNDEQLEHIISQHSPQLNNRSSATKAPIDLHYVNKELKHKGVTRELLWKEYQASATITPYSYTGFCRQYRQFKKQLKPSMRQTHVAGEKVFVDYAGPTVPIINSQTGEIKNAVIFVGVLGASNFTFAEATLTRRLPDWLGSHTRMYEYFGGVPEMTIPDNEKSGVNHACYYEPELNVNYAALASHYDTVILPTRPATPKDKAKVEVAVQIVERWILARLRHDKFFSLKQLNQAISQLLIELNDKPFKKLPGTRRSQFELVEKETLKPLPTTRYQYFEIKKATVRLDYHVEIDGHFYSVPHRFILKRVDYQLSAERVELFYKGQSIANHIRSNEKGQATTIASHMPLSHQRYQQWTPQQFVDWSENVGQSMLHVANKIISTRTNPECLRKIHHGFINLGKRYGHQRLDAACHYALAHELLSFSHVRSVLQSQIDKAPKLANNDKEFLPKALHNEHVRGATYYSTQDKQEI